MWRSKRLNLKGNLECLSSCTAPLPVHAVKRPPSSYRCASTSSYRGSLDTTCSFHRHLLALACVSDRGIRVRQVVPISRYNMHMHSGTGTTVTNTRRLISSDDLLQPYFNQSAISANCTTCYIFTPLNSKAAREATPKPSPCITAENRLVGVYPDVQLSPETRSETKPLVLLGLRNRWHLARWHSVVFDLSVSTRYRSALSAVSRIV